MRVAAIDIDKVSSFWSEFGWTSLVLLFLRWLLASFSPGCKFIFLHQIGFRIREVLKGATQLSRGSGYNCLLRHPSTLQIPWVLLEGGEGSHGWQVPQGWVFIVRPWRVVLDLAQSAHLLQGPRQLKISPKESENVTEAWGQTSQMLYLLLNIHLLWKMCIFLNIFPPKYVWAGCSNG